MDRRTLEDPVCCRTRGGSHDEFTQISPAHRKAAEGALDAYPGAAPSEPSSCDFGFSSFAAPEDCLATVH